MVCYDHLFHFTNPDVDDDSMNRALGEAVFCALPLPDPGPEGDLHGVRGLFRTAWAETDTLLKRLSDNAGLATLEGKSVEEFVWQWSMILGRPLSADDVINRGTDSGDYAWCSPGPALLNQLWYASRSSVSTFDDVIARGDALESVGAAAGAKANRELLHSMITECNCRSYVNERLANHLDLPYVANTARLPFRSLYYDLPRAVTDALPSVLAADSTYVERAAHADLLRGDPLVLPVFLALALNDAKRPGDLWAAIAGLRTEATRFRERRAELDHALEVGDKKQMERIRIAIGTEAASLTETLAAAGWAAGKGFATSVVAHPVAHVSGHAAPWVATGLATTIAGARKLIPRETAQATDLAPVSPRAALPFGYNDGQSRGDRFSS
jgi:hypothetical protein